MPDPKASAYPNLRLIYPSGLGELEVLYSDLLEGSEDNPLPAKRILHFLLRPNAETGEPIARTIIEESDYTDRDYIESYSRYYAAQYFDIKRKCTRLHFFGRRVGADELLNLEVMEDDYLGYVVVRPTDSSRIGRCVISPPVREGEERYVLGQSKHLVNLSGSKLGIRGVPFMEQDTRVASCASAAVWMATEGLRGRFGLRTATSTEITALATRYTVEHGRPVPNPGLSDQQIMRALTELGYEPLYLYDLNLDDARSNLDFYAESEIPTILGLANADDEPGPGHVVTVVGHTFVASEGARAKPRPLREDQEPYGSRYEHYDWIPEWICHDDQRGPYQGLRVVEGADGECCVEIGSSEEDPGNERARFKLETMIIPLPKDIALNGEEARARSIRLLISAHSLHGNFPIEEIVLRTYLIRSNDFKRSLIDVHDEESPRREGMSEWLVRLYRGLTMPRFIWVTEVTYRDLISAPNPSDRRTVGEILLDSHASPDDDRFIVVHTPGKLALMRPDEDDPVGALGNALDVEEAGHSGMLLRSP